MFHYTTKSCSKIKEAHLGGLLCIGIVCSALTPLHAWLIVYDKLLRLGEISTLESDEIKPVTKKIRGEFE